MPYWHSITRVYIDLKGKEDIDKSDKTSRKWSLFSFTLVFYHEKRDDRCLILTLNIWN